MSSSFLLEHNGRVYLTGHAQVVPKAVEDEEKAWAREAIAAEHPAFLWVVGKFVEADQANLNKQYWSTKDLEFGQFSVQYTPMNMLHQMTSPVGVYTEAKLFEATDTANCHIQALGALWAHRFPQEAAIVEMASECEQLFFSMECVGEKLHCKGGCEQEFDYFAPETFCTHLQERSSVRHIINPYFTGGGIIVPPAKPAWPNAEVEVVDLTAAYARRMDDIADSQAEVDDSLTASQWRTLMSLVLSNVKR